MREKSTRKFFEGLGFFLSSALIVVAMKIFQIGDL